MQECSAHHGQVSKSLKNEIYSSNLYHFQQGIFGASVAQICTENLWLK